MIVIVNEWSIGSKVLFIMKSNMSESEDERLIKGTDDKKMAWEFEGFDESSSDLVVRRVSIIIIELQGMGKTIALLGEEKSL